MGINPDMDALKWAAQLSKEEHQAGCICGHDVYSHSVVNFWVNDTTPSCRVLLTWWGKRCPCMVYTPDVDFHRNED